MFSMADTRRDIVEKKDDTTPDEAGKKGAAWKGALQKGYKL